MVALRVSSLSRIVTLFLCLVLFGIIIVLPAPVRSQGGPPPRLKIALALPKEALPWSAEATFTVTITNEGSEPATAVQLQLPHNRAIVYIGKVADPETAVSSATFELGDIKAGESLVTDIGFRVVGVPQDGGVEIHAQAKASGTPAVHAKELLSIRPFAPEEVNIAAAGGELAAEDGRVAFTFPPDWHEAEATVSFQLEELYQTLTGDAGTLVSFSVEAKAGALVESFDAPVAVSIKVGDLLPAEQASADAAGRREIEESRLNVVTR